jgi:CDP-glycerol glycerophosphotransferase (TagB/SpsB family)
MFNKFLNDNDILFLLKLHPYEEKFFYNIYKSSNIKNLRFITNNLLDQHKIDLYKIVNSTDLLITDYSSVYFDYLLTNKPILFTPTDLDSYSSSRGLLVEDYDFWTPGLKAFNLDEFMRLSIISVEKDPFKLKRKQLKNEIHRYADGMSTDRFIKFLLTCEKKNEK